MAKLVHEVIDGWNDLMENKSDPRVKDWLGMSSPFPTIFICMMYFWFVLDLGPRFMANRKPFELKRTILVYNFIQVILSTYLVYKALVNGWATHYSWRCQPVDYSNDPQAMGMAAGCHLYYLSKFLELFDTIFFVLRKKNKQITPLHVFHHGVMPMSTWPGVKFAPGGNNTFFGMINAFVHIWMYAYYFLAALGPSIQPYLWWKRYLTSMQIIQFVIVVIHSTQAFFMDCNFPKIFFLTIGLHAAVFFVLFNRFYRETYSKDGKKLKNDKHVSDDKKSGQTSKNGLANGTGKKEQSSIYANNYNVATGYISDEGLRNRVFIDKNGGFNQS